jgi:hypothetical protein
MKWSFLLCLNIERIFIKDFLKSRYIVFLSVGKAIADSLLPEMKARPIK